MKTRVLAVTLAISATLLWGTVDVAAGAAGGLLDSWDISVSKFLHHPTLPVLYASVPGENTVVVIDSESLAVTNTIPIGLKPQGMALSLDGTRLYVATGGSADVAVYDTVNGQVLTPLPVSSAPADVAAGYDGRLWVRQGERISEIDAATGAVTGPYLHTYGYLEGLPSVTVYWGSLAMSPDRRTLYYGNGGLSPATLYKLDVTDTDPALIKQIGPGSNGQDLEISRDGEYICYACGSGNGYGYTIFKLRTSDLGHDLEFNTGPYPREVTFGPEGDYVYAVHTSGEIDMFHAQTGIHLDTFATAGEAHELIVDNSGEHLFAAFGSQLRVYGTGVPEPTTLLLLAAGLPFLLKRRKADYLPARNMVCKTRREE